MLALCGASTTISAQVKQQDNTTYYQYAFITIRPVKSIDLKKNVWLIAIRKGNNPSDDYENYTDETGKWPCYDNLMDAFNFIESEGWELFSHNTNVDMCTQWIARKKISKNELIKMVTKNKEHILK